MLNLFWGARQLLRVYDVDWVVHLVDYGGDQKDEKVSSRSWKVPAKSA